MVDYEEIPSTYCMGMFVLRKLVPLEEVGRLDRTLCFATFLSHFGRLVLTGSI